MYQNLPNQTDFQSIAHQKWCNVFDFAAHLGQVYNVSSNNPRRLVNSHERMVLCLGAKSGTDAENRARSALVLA
eukprot:2830702-Rhodomonas_salina.1